MAMAYRCAGIYALLLKFGLNTTNFFKCKVGAEKVTFALLYLRASGADGSRLHLRISMHTDKRMNACASMMSFTPSKTLQFVILNEVQLDTVKKLFGIQRPSWGAKRTKI